MLRKMQLVEIDFMSGSVNIESEHGKNKIVPFDRYAKCDNCHDQREDVDD